MHKKYDVYAKNDYGTPYKIGEIRERPDYERQVGEAVGGGATGGVLYYLLGGVFILLWRMPLVAVPLIFLIMGTVEAHYAHQTYDPSGWITFLWIVALAATVLGARAMWRRYLLARDGYGSTIYFWLLLVFAVPELILINGLAAEDVQGGMRPVALVAGLLLVVSSIGCLVGISRSGNRF